MSFCSIVINPVKRRGSAFNTLEDVDWFLVIGYDVFVNPESLEEKLGEFNASFQVYMGHSVEEGDSYKCSYGPGVVYIQPWPAEFTYCIKL